MNVAEVAGNLLTYFSPEERSIPDSQTYPGRNAAVAKAINDALQDLFGKGEPWVRNDDRGYVFHAPVQIEVEVNKGSQTLTIASSSWEPWFAGCTINIDGAEVENQIRSAATVVTPYPANSILLSGDLFGTVGPSGRYKIPTPLPLLWTGTDDDGFRIYTAVTADGQALTMQRLNTGDESEFYGWTLQMAGPLLGGVWANAGNGDSPIGLSDWRNEDGSLGKPTIAATGPNYVHQLKFPFSGESGIRTATIFHDSFDLGNDVLEVHEPVRFDRRSLHPMNNPLAGAKQQRRDDYGFTGGCDSGGTEKGIEETVGTPRRYQVGTWLPSTKESPKIRMRLYPAPGHEGFLEYSVMLCPPFVTALNSTDSLPIPFNFVESILLPIAVKKLRVCPFWRGIIGDDDVNRNYQAALDELNAANPQKRSGLNLVWNF